MTSSTRRLAPEVIEADRTALLALQSIPDYAPLNAACRIEALHALEAALTRAEQEELRARNAMAVARATAIAAAQDLHNAMLAAKAQVIAQYGDDSTVVLSLGRKRKSERKRPTRRRAQPSA